MVCDIIKLIMKGKKMSDAVAEARENLNLTFFDPEGKKKTKKNVSMEELKKVAARARKIFDEAENDNNL